jgi:hypothetical protein
MLNVYDGYKKIYNLYQYEVDTTFCYFVTGQRYWRHVKMSSLSSIFKTWNHWSWRSSIFSIDYQVLLQASLTWCVKHNDWLTPKDSLVHAFLQELIVIWISRDRTKLCKLSMCIRFLNGLLSSLNYRWNCRWLQNNFACLFGWSVIKCFVIFHPACT